MSGPISFAKLRQFVGQDGASSAERCDLCGAPLSKEHDHLVESQKGRLSCSCTACAILFPVRKDARFKRVPRRVMALSDLAPAELWCCLGLPVNLAFLVRSSQTGVVTALYPSPAGATPGTVDEESWKQMTDLCPALGDMEPDVEALLLHSLHGARDAFIAPIDRCYQLIGRLRTHWKGLSGGDRVRVEIDDFLEQLRMHAKTSREGLPHA